MDTLVPLVSLLMFGFIGLVCSVKKAPIRYFLGLIILTLLTGCVAVCCGNVNIVIGSILMFVSIICFMLGSLTRRGEI